MILRVLLVLCISSCQLFRASDIQREVPHLIANSRRTLHLFVAKDNSPFLNREGLLFVDSGDLTPSNREDVYRIDLLDAGSKLIICDHIVLMSEYGGLDYSQWRDWQLPYFLHVPRVCMLEATSDVRDGACIFPIETIILLIQLLQRGIIFNYKWFNKSGIQVPDSQSLTLGRLPNNISYYSQSFVDPTSANHLLPYLPPILSLDSDILVTNKHLTFDDFLMRIQKGLSTGSYLPGKGVSEPLDIGNVHFAMGVDGSMSRRWPVNAGILWVRPSNPVIKILSAAILIAGNTSPYWGDAQGGMAHLIEHLGGRLPDLMEMYHLVQENLPEDRPMLSFSFENISNVETLDLRQKKKTYVQLLQYLTPKDDQNVYGIVIPGNWMNSWGCAHPGGKYFWKLGDWIVHFYGCAHKSCVGVPCPVHALEVMALFPEIVATPPDVNWTRVVKEGIPVGNDHGDRRPFKVLVLISVVLMIGYLCLVSRPFQVKRRLSLLKP